MQQWDVEESLMASIKIETYWNVNQEGEKYIKVFARLK